MDPRDDWYSNHRDCSTTSVRVALVCCAGLPSRLVRANSNPDSAVARRAVEAMMTMGKIDIARIEVAERGEAIDA